jgi:hypothetical protein
MSSAETPPDPDEPPPTEEEMWEAARNFGVAIILLIMAAIAIPYINP